MCVGCNGQVRQKWSTWLSGNASATQVQANALLDFCNKPEVCVWCEPVNWHHKSSDLPRVWLPAFLVEGVTFGKLIINIQRHGSTEDVEAFCIARFMPICCVTGCWTEACSLLTVRLHLIRCASPWMRRGYPCDS